jgi:hypothetical protein
MTDIQLACNLLVAAALHEQAQDLLFAARDFELIEIGHDLFRKLLRPMMWHFDYHALSYIRDGAVSP